MTECVSLASFIVFVRNGITEFLYGRVTLIPLISLVCAFLLSTRKDKKIYNYNRYIFFFIGVVIIVLAEIIVRYSGYSWTHTAVYYLLPILMLPMFYLILIKKFKYENLS